MDGLVNRVASEAPLLLLVALATLAISIPVLVWRVRAGARIFPAARHTALEAGVLGSLAVIAAVTLGTFAGGGIGEVNWVPFRSLFDNAKVGEFWVGLVVVDLVGNALLYLPLGLFVGLRLPSLSIRALVVGVIALSATIEIGQGLVLNRSADITDVIMNTLGGALGFVLARIVRRIARIEGSRPAPSS